MSETEAKPVTIGQLDTQQSDRVAYGFYGFAALFALVGQTWAAVDQIEPKGGYSNGWALAGVIVPAALAVGVIELGGVATSALADARQRIGERATVYRVLSATVALFAVAFNVYGHWSNPYLSAVFGGLSAFAYVLWLAHSSARRRDALRAANKLAGTAPSYGMKRWVFDYANTRRARELALENDLGLFASLAAARDEKEASKRRRAVAATVEKVIRKGQEDGDLADIAVSTYDLDRLARLVEARADYDGWASLIGTSLLPTGTRAAVGTPAATAETGTSERAGTHLHSVPPGTDTPERAGTDRAADPVPSPASPADEEAEALAFLASMGGMPPGTPTEPASAPEPERAADVPVELADDPATSTVPPVTVPERAGTRATARVAFMAPTVPPAREPADDDPTVPLAVLTDVPPGKPDTGTTGTRPATRSSGTRAGNPVELAGMPAPSDLAGMSDSELRAAAQKTVLACRRAGVPVSGTALGTAYGRSERWGRSRIQEVDGTPARGDSPLRVIR